WRFEGQTLVTPKESPARIQIPYTPPSEYELSMTVRRLDGTGIFNVGLIAANTPFILGLDGEGRSGLEILDGKMFHANETTHPGMILPVGREATVVCTVRNDGVMATCDGKVIVDWKGNYRRLTFNKGWQVPNPNQLWIGEWSSVFHVSMLVLRP